MFVFFFNDTATTEIYTLSLHDALPISHADLKVEPGVAGRKVGAAQVDLQRASAQLVAVGDRGGAAGAVRPLDRKSTRLNSSHANISYAVFCLKKKNTKNNIPHHTGKTI